MKKILIVCSLILSGGGGYASGMGGRPGEIFQFGSSARTIGMGGAFTAMAQGASALGDNPAGLSGTPGGLEVTTTRARLYESAAYQYLGLAYRGGGSATGIGVEAMRMGIEGVEGYDGSGNRTGTFGFSQTSIGLGAARSGVLHPALSFGVKGKVLMRSLASSPDSLYGADVGAQLGPFLGERLSFGLLVQNAFSFSRGDTEDRLERVLRAGAAFRVLGPVRLVADGTVDEFRVGTEYDLGALALRAGHSPQGFVFGAGTKIDGRFRFDVAIQSHSELGMTERLSLTYRFRGREPDANPSDRGRAYPGPAGLPRRWKLGGQGIESPRSRDAEEWYPDGLNTGR